MRILLTTDTIGGVWTFTRELSEGLLAAGHSVALVSFGRMPSSEQQVWATRMYNSKGSLFEYVPSAAPLEWMQNNEDIREAVDTLNSVLHHFQPHLLHSNQYYTGDLALDVPKLITAHSDVLSWADACRPHGIETTPWLTRYRDLVQTGLDVADAVVAPTTATLQGLRSHFRVDCPSHVVPNGRTVSSQSRTSARRKQAVSAGRLWDEAKGLSTLLTVQSRVPLLIAGEDTFEETSTKNLLAQIQPVGTLTEEELLTLFSESSAYIVTSLYEPFGLAPLEAALCGCAIIAHDLPSLREVWEDAAVYFRTSQELSSHLNNLFAGDRSLLAAQSAAKRRALHFTAHRMTTSYISLYEELVARTDSHTHAQQELASHAA